MSLARWGTAFLKLGLLLLAIGLLPALVMAVVFPSATPAAIPALLSLSVAPLGGICLLAGLAMWAIGAARR